MDMTCCHAVYCHYKMTGCHVSKSGLQMNKIRLSSIALQEYIKLIFKEYETGGKL
jgi:hypothetical protein